MPFTNGFSGILAQPAISAIPASKPAGTGRRHRASAASIRRLLAPGGFSRYISTMNREHIIATLRAHERELRDRGVAHVALFGSRARQDARTDSDTDIMVEIEPSAHIGVWGYAGLKEYIATLFDGPVDVVDRAALKPNIGPAADTDAVYAF
jgi:predicted nucleotidyltransferase